MGLVQVLVRIRWFPAQTPAAQPLHAVQPDQPPSTEAQAAKKILKSKKIGKVRDLKTFLKEWKNLNTFA